MNVDLNIIVFGSTGLMGTAFETVCRKRSISYVGMSHQDIEITSMEMVNNVIERYNPDTIINCVAVPSIDPCEKDPELPLALHCTAVLHLAKECAKRDILFVQPSTHAVFDGLKEEPYTEDDQVKATNIYSATKLLSERFVATYCKKYYIPRFPTLYGLRQNNSMGFVDKVITWIREGRDMKIADDKMDSPTYSIDAAEVVISLIVNNEPYGLYHVANNGCVSYYDFVIRIKELMNADNNIYRAKDSDFSSEIYKPLRTALQSVKLKPIRSYEDALLDYVNTDVIGVSD
ncbi:MAG: dTDP-4-dehydrorhamnose reductase [Candidatus Scalindua rubra]|uniref:dTDP-4-dehydrorhamnose reductase n=1 Tax=Candidatus Scalindua rubra TaxID=1872076 RepID=A0A1E3X382_9BACT|nr:MAG: dTDP-4-dehydrorhamnose reductase [Candidatus Scalindua rubra]